MPKQRNLAGHSRRSTTSGWEEGNTAILPVTTTDDYEILNFPPTHPEEGRGRLGKATAGPCVLFNFPFRAPLFKSKNPYFLFDILYLVFVYAYVMLNVQVPGGRGGRPTGSLLAGRLPSGWRRPKTNGLPCQ